MSYRYRLSSQTLISAATVGDSGAGMELAGSVATVRSGARSDPNYVEGQENETHGWREGSLKMIFDTDYI